MSWRPIALAVLVHLAWGCAGQPQPTTGTTEPPTPPTEPAAAGNKGCEPSAVDPGATPAGSGWGLDLENTRFQTADYAALPRNAVSKLRVLWTSPSQPGSGNAQPAVVGDTVFYGHASGVGAADVTTGCPRWTGRYGASPTTGFATLGWGTPEPTLFFGDDAGRVAAVNGLTGALRWSAQLDSRPQTKATGAALHSPNVLYASFSSTSETVAGGIAALNAKTGELLWKSDGRGGNNDTQIPFFGNPTLDTERGLLYAATGPNQAAAITALELETGRERWRFVGPETGATMGFRAPPVLVRAEEGDILIAAHESGIVYGIDPGSGEWIWERQLVAPIRSAIAALGDTLLIPLTRTAASVPGIFALDAYSGKTRWQYRNRSGVIEPLTAFPAGVVARYGDGSLRVHDGDDGSVLWSTALADSDSTKLPTAGPIVAGGRIILATPDGALIALGP